MKIHSTARTSLAFAVMACISVSSWGHNNETHNDPGVSVEIDNSSGINTLPISITGEFELIDHNGNAVSARDYSGKHMLVFFGYTSCKNMCSLSLNRLGKAMEHLGDAISHLSALIITVDPQRDSPAILKTELDKYHPSLIGLTGTETQLQTAYSNFNQAPESAGEDWNSDTIISHSSYIYLLDENGELATLFPPILNPQSMADIILKYIRQPS